MTTLTITSRGQVTFKREVLKHLGLRPGDKIRLDLLRRRRLGGGTFVSFDEKAVELLLSGGSSAELLG